MSIRDKYKTLTAGLVPLRNAFDGSKHWVDPSHVVDAVQGDDKTVTLFFNDSSKVDVIGTRDEIVAQLGLVDQLPRERNAAPPEPKAAQAREVIFRGATGVARVEQLEGRDYLVVPIVALVEGVIHPINAPEAEFVPAASFSVVPQGWNGRPVFCGHPVNSDGNQVSGNTPDKLPEAFGKVFNSKTDGRRLVMEAWLDIARCEELGGDAMRTLERARAGDPVEVSVGAFVVTEAASGQYGGRKYALAWSEVTPDHLALLPEGDEGACSRAMGCGLRAAVAHKITQSGVQYESMEAHAKSAPGLLARLGNLLKSLHMGEDDLGESDTDKRRMLQEALTIVEPGVGSLWIESLYDDFVVYCIQEKDSPVQAYWQRAYVINGSTGEIGLSGDKIQVEPVMHYEPVEFAAAKGARHSGKDMALVQAMHDHSVELGATCAPKAAGAKPEGDMDMTKCEKTAAVVKGLKAEVKAKYDALAKKSNGGDILAAILGQIKEKFGLSDAAASDLENLEESTLAELAGLAAPADAPAEGDKASSDNTPGADGKVPPPAASASYTGAAAAKTPVTTEEWLAAAPTEVKTLVADARAKEDARKAVLVTAIVKVAKDEYTEAELKAMSVKELERINRVCKANAPDIDYSGLGAPRAETEETKAAPAPPDMNAMIRDRNKK